jgi:hypothetical protein
MTRTPALSTWIDDVSTHMGHLSVPQRTVLALWSFGIVLAQACGIPSVAAILAGLTGRTEGAVRQQLREWCYDAADKCGDQRQTLDVTSCFAPLLAWVLARWPASERRLALALDASTLGQRFTILAISVVYRGCAIPVAWTLLRPTTRGRWKPHWCRLVQTLAPAVPPDWTVIVLADRGLYARWLFRQIVDLGWHPVLRINQQGQYRPAGAARYRPLQAAAPVVGQCWAGRVTCFRDPASQLDCTLLVRWDAGHTDPWLLVTDVAPEAAEALWYGMRMWIEADFRLTKRGGWHWERTKMTDPARAERLWLAIAVATLWVVAVGGEADATLPASSLPTEVEDAHPPARPRRGLSCFRRGVIVILIALSRQEPLPVGRFIPEPWPESLDTCHRPNQQQLPQQKAAA